MLYKTVEYQRANSNALSHTEGGALTVSWTLEWSWLPE